MQGVSELTGVAVAALASPGKKREDVKARSLLCYWAVTELGMSLTDPARKLEGRSDRQFGGPKRCTIGGSR